ncbi:hypothetical protein IPJ72_01425 [Candidatus Peregrinibacteria bacterium]|nr:MAG: hypothetical protein IPJ72_01425 [Candidatus Peregrinibacteria bacterium]
MDVIKSEVKYDKALAEDSGLPTRILYYCRDCKALTNPKRIGKKLQFTCGNCKSKNVSFGTEQSIGNYYKASTN